MPAKVIKGELHLSGENSKLGRVQNFSVMPKRDCPGATEECLLKCYAAQGNCCRYAFPYWKHNSNLVRKNPHILIDLVPRIKGPIFRIHTGGDFLTVGVVEAWTHVAFYRKDVKFWTYTRSWRIPEMLEPIRELNRLSNVTIWTSCDKGTGRPPYGFQRSYMALTDDDIPGYNVDLIFRVNRDTPAIRLGGIVVCPKESGTKTGKKINCQKCGICFR
jgi:hypothetical protein